MKKTLLITTALLLIILSTTAQIRKRYVEPQRVLTPTTSISGTITLNTDKSPAVCTLGGFECYSFWTVDLYEVIDPEQGGAFVNTSYKLKSLRGMYKYTVTDMGNRTYQYNFSNVPKNIKTIITFSCQEKIYKADNADNANKRILEMYRKLNLVGAIIYDSGLQTNRSNLITMVTNESPNIVRDISISDVVIHVIH